MFDSCVVSCSLGSEAETEYVSVIGTVPDEKGSVRFARQAHLGLFEAKWTPVPTTLLQININTNSYNKAL